MRRPVVGALLALATTFGLGAALPAPATGGAGATTAAERRGEPASAAEGVLHRAEAALGLASDHSTARLSVAGSAPARALPRRDVTTVLRDLRLALPDLTGAARDRGESLLARPTDGAADDLGDGYRTSSVKRCSTDLCLHWVRTGRDAPPGGPWVSTTMEVVKQVWTDQIDRLGYHPPLPDGRRGGNAKFDVYLKDLGGRGVYGYCAAEPGGDGRRWSSPGYCVLDDDFSRDQYGTPPQTSLRVTAAHEFFHAIQFGYDYAEDLWLMENTATWMEERFADDANDNRQYLDHGQVALPGSSLDVFDPDGFSQYGNWPFFEFLSDRHGNGIVKRIWQLAGARKGSPDLYSAEAVGRVLAKKSGLARTFAAYAGGNTVPHRTYAEGEHWPQSKMARTWTLGKSERRQEATLAVNHLAARNVMVEPHRSLDGPRWRLRVVVDGPGAATSPAAYLVVRRPDAAWTTRQIWLDDTGRGATTVPFRHGEVSRATVTLANASTRYRCWRNDPTYSCQGKPRDQQRDFAVRVSVFKD